jgi:hypothetical protein
MQFCRIWVSFTAGFIFASLTSLIDKSKGDF